MKIDRESVAWGGPHDDWYWVYFTPNWLPPDCRYLGYAQDWYDGPMSSFGFWWFNISWSLPWTAHNGDNDWSLKSKEYREWIRKRELEIDSMFTKKD